MVQEAGRELPDVEAMRQVGIELLQKQSKRVGKLEETFGEDDRYGRIILHQHGILEGMTQVLHDIGLVTDEDIKKIHIKTE